MEKSLRRRIVYFIVFFLMCYASMLTGFILIDNQGGYSIFLAAISSLVATGSVEIFTYYMQKKKSEANDM